MGEILTGYLTPTEAAAELAINPRTLERWNRLNEGPPRLKIGRRVYYRAEALRDWLRSLEQAVEAS